MPLAPPMRYQTVDAMDSPHKFFTHMRNVIQVLERFSNKYQHVHGDIQPSNILCLPDGSTKLLLFDYAKDHGWNENKYRMSILENEASIKNMALKTMKEMGMNIEDLLTNPEDKPERQRQQQTCPSSQNRGSSCEMEILEVD